MCEHCNHERELKVGDCVKVDWQKALESGFGDYVWVVNNAFRADMKQGTILDINNAVYLLTCCVKFQCDKSLWLNKDWLTLVDKPESNSTTSETEKENENMSMDVQENTITCEHCGCVIKPGEEHKTWNGNCFCEDCKDNYEYCDDCGRYVSARQGIPIYDGNGDIVKFVCPNCTDNYYICDVCGEYVLSEALVDTGCENATLCEHCADTSYRWELCADCNEYHRDCEEIGGEYYCEDCARQHRYDEHNSENSDYVNSYGYKPRPEFHSTVEESDNSALYMGVELEIDSGDEDVNAVECAEELHSIDYGTELFYLKHDGSLNEPGIEIVTHPCTLAYHTDCFPWEEVVETAKRDGYSSHDIGTCGLHVHVSRTALGNNSGAQELVIAKIVIMMDNLWDYLVKFSRRNYNQLRWTKKMNACVNEMDTEDEAIEKTKMAALGERYHALNLLNTHTIEFRLFRGTLKLNTIMATLQFVDGMCRYAMAHTVKECLATSWMDLANSIDYPEFQQYLRERDLTNDEEPYQDNGYESDED